MAENTTSVKPPFSIAVLPPYQCPQATRFLFQWCRTAREDSMPASITALYVGNWQVVSP